MSALTQKTSGRLGLLGIAVILVAALAFFGPPSQAEVTVEADAGVILLSTGPDAGDNWVRYYADTSTFDVGTPTAEQPLVLDRCGVSSDDSILEITESGARRGVGLVSNGLGTRDKNNCATDGGQVEVGQSITFAVGSMFGPDVAIDLVEVDVEGKQNAELRYQLDDRTAVTATLNSTSDNGPDSGTSDNVIKVITPDVGDDPFTSITFAPTGNSKALISIEGGGDGPLAGGTERTTLGVNTTLFRLVSHETYDGEILCGDPTVTATPNANGPADEAFLQRLDNIKDGTCTLIPYTFQIEDDDVFLDYLNDGQGAHFLVKIVWDPDDTMVNPLAPPIRKVNYFDDVSANYVDGVACTQITEGTNIDVLPDDDDVFQHPTSDGTIPSGDGTFFSSGETVPVCLAGQQVQLVGSDWVQTQWWDVTSDPRWR